MAWKNKIQVEQYSCQKCLHKWLPRKGVPPRVCPACKSAWWQIAKNTGRKANDSNN